MKTGIVDVGGGMRGIYAAGVMDYCMDNDIKFDTYIGASAGSANVISFMAGQKGRNYRFFKNYSARKEYMGFDNYLKNKSFINLQYIYGTLSNSDGEDPLDFKKVCENPGDLFVVASDAITGNPKYFTKDDMSQDDYRPLMASSCVPAVNRPIEIGGRYYYDGAVSDPVPINKALSEGCDKVVLVLTRPADVPRKTGKQAVAALKLKRKAPVISELLKARAGTYNRMIAKARKLEKEGRLIIISPDDISGVDTLKRNDEAMDRLYKDGYKDAEKIKNWL